MSAALSSRPLAAFWLAHCMVVDRLVNPDAKELVMAEVVFVFTEPVVTEGREYHAQVCGRPAGHVWEGWIEFAATDGAEVLRTARETTQPDRDALEYWARGLSMTYLESALTRAMDPSRVAPRDVIATPHFTGPAPSVVTPEPVVVSPAVVDPYSVAAKGEEYLRQKLNALGARHLRNIVRAYELADESTDLEVLTESELIELIVAAVASPS
jgi:hypothetical protein